MKFHMLMLMNEWMMLVLMQCKCQMQCLTLGCYRQGLVRASHGELKLTAMAGAHGAVARSHADAVVAVKWAMTLASRPYSDDQQREKKVGGAVVVAGHGRA